MSAGSFPQFGAKFTLQDDGSSKAVEQQIVAVDSAMEQLALALDRGEIGLQDYAQSSRELIGIKRDLARAAQTLAAVQQAANDAADQERQSMAAAAESVAHAAAEYRAMAEAKAAADRSDLAHQSDLDAIAIQHQTEMLEHEERQLRATKAAEDALVDAIGRSVQADLAASNATESLASDRTQSAAALAKEIDFERLDASLKHQQAQAARELADAEEDAAAAIHHETEILGIRTTKTDQYGNAVMHVGGSTRNWGMAALEASRGLEDLQYGIAGGLNNIPTLTMMLGGPAGLTAGISVFAVTAKVAYDHWDDLMSAFGRSSPIPDLTRQLADLEKQIKTIDETKVKMLVDVSDLDIAKTKLDDLKRGQAEYEALQRKQTSSEAKSGKAIDELITEAPNGGAQGVRKDATDFLRAQAVANSVTIREARAQRAQAEQDLKDAAEFEVPMFGAGGGDAMAGAQKRIDAAKKSENAARAAIETQITAQFGQMVDKAKTGNNQEQTRNREDLAATLRGAGRTELAGKIANATPEAIDDAEKAMKALDDELKGILKEVESGAAAQKKARSELDRAIAYFDKDSDAGTKRLAQGQKVQEKLDVESNKRVYEQETESIKASGMAPQAESMLAQVQAQFGVTHRMNRDQQFDFVQRQVAQQLAKRNPGMGAQQRGDVATRITAMGMQSLRKDVQGELGLATQTVSAMGGLNAAQARQQAQIIALQSVVAKINADVMARGQNARNRGRGG